VSNAGGIGCFSAHDLPASDIKTTAAEIRAQTQKPFALHLWVGKEGPATIEREQFIRMLSWFVPYYRELAISAPPLPKAIGEDYDVQVEAVLAAQPHVFSFAFGIPSPDILRHAASAPSRLSAAQPAWRRLARWMPPVSTPSWPSALKPAATRDLSCIRTSDRWSERWRSCRKS
jgi:NAD(P)H-dependent flavin oxidoreductase YrpB (nitropropane dioxygenase family)